MIKKLEKSEGMKKITGWAGGGRWGEEDKEEKRQKREGVGEEGNPIRIYP